MLQYGYMLTVPLVQQPHKSTECGVASVAMILSYYKIPYDYEELRTEIIAKEWGAAMPQLGLYLLGKGFSVEIITVHPSLFAVQSRFADSQSLINHFLSLEPTFNEPHNLVTLQYFIQFVKHGGIVTPRVPVKQDIADEIDVKRPLIAPLSHCFLFETGKMPRFCGHYNVITGIDHEFVFVNDPDWETPFGGQHKHRIEDYIYAMYAGASRAIDNASLMKIAKSA